MGATGWSYFVPYEADISAALQRLREDVFARGEYTYGVDAHGVTEEQLKAFVEKARPELDPWMEKVREQAAMLPEHIREKFLENAEKIKKQLSGDIKLPKPKKKPKTIEQALKHQAESGTHSILDISEISAEPKFGAVTPLPCAKLIEFFGTEPPTRAQIEDADSFDKLEEYVSERWQGIYIIAYRDGVPSEINFAGCSGD